MKFTRVLSAAAGNLKISYYLHFVQFGSIQSTMCEWQNWLPSTPNSYSYCLLMPQYLFFHWTGFVRCSFALRWAQSRLLYRYRDKQKRLQAVKFVLFSSIEYSSWCGACGVLTTRQWTSLLHFKQSNTNTHTHPPVCPLIRSMQHFLRWLKQRAESRRNLIGARTATTTMTNTIKYALISRAAIVRVQALRPYRSVPLHRV